MKKYIKAALFVLFAACFSCEEKGWFIKCNDCTPDEPADAILNIKLNSTGTAVRVNIFEGNLEDSIFYLTEVVTWPEFSYYVPLNKKYTVTATYYFDGKKYVAVDSATPRVRYTNSQCDDPCYYIYDNDVNLRIKYKVNGN